MGVPEYYLGGDFKIQKGPNGIETFSLCAETYLTNICEKIEKLMGVSLKRYETPMATGVKKGVILSLSRRDRKSIKG